MPISADQLRDNPWWGDDTAIERDPHLRSLAREHLVFQHDIPFSLETDAVLTLRGPSQVGKTTLMKRMARRRLEVGVPPRSIIYLDTEGANLRTPNELQDALREYLEWMRSSLARPAR